MWSRRRFRTSLPPECRGDGTDWLMLLLHDFPTFAFCSNNLFLELCSASDESNGAGVPNLFKYIFARKSIQQAVHIGVICVTQKISGRWSLSVIGRTKTLSSFFLVAQYSVKPFSMHIVFIVASQSSGAFGGYHWCR